MKKMIKNSWDAGRRRDGFTLVELIVVLVLIGLLAAVSAGGMLGYTYYAQYKRNNDSAKTVFSAAQSAISYYKASGRLEDLRRDIETLPQSPTFVPEEAFADMGTDAESETRKSNTDKISYLMMSKSDDTYSKIEEAVKNGSFPSDVDEQTQLLFRMLSDYITDVSLYDASICVEFDATDGVVSGVFYCDKDTGFSYTDSDEKINITKRDESYCRRKGLGYYSTELYERAPEKVEDLEIVGAKLVNAETLDVQWFLEKKYQWLKRDQDYTITLKDESGKTLVKIVLEKEADADGVGLISNEAGGHAYVQAKSVTLYSESGEPHSLTMSPGSVGGDGGEGVGSGIMFHAYQVYDESKDEKENYGDGLALSLDVLDSYAVKALDETDPAAKETGLLSTYSARRLSYTDTATGEHYGLSADGVGKIQATVSLAGDEDGAKTTNLESVFFADGRESGSDGSGPEYEIENARHLYNASLREKENTSGAAYKITKDFAWGGPEGLLSYAKTENEETGAARIPTKFYNQQGEYVYTADAGEPAFPGIDVLNSSSRLLSAKAAKASEDASEEDEKSEDSETAGDTEPPYTIDYLTLAPRQTDGMAAPGEVGLVRVNQGTIQGLRLANVNVRGIVKQTGMTAEGESVTGSVWLSGENVGAFCGVNEGTLQDVETISGSVTGGRNVGGIMGSLAATATVSGIRNGAEVSGVENVGGIVGLLDAGRSLEGTAEQKIENTGIVYGWELPDGTLNRMENNMSTIVSEVTAKYIGGIAGRVKGGASLAYCVSAPALKSAAQDAEGAGDASAEVQERMHGDYVGGIVGYLETSARVANCTVGAADGSASYILGENYVGGIAGWNQGKVVTNSADRITATILGRNFVGGVIGMNTSTDQVSGELSWNAQDVGGNFYVGGYAGANIIAGSPSVTVSGSARSVTAQAFAGGLFGYNRIVTSDKLAQLLPEAAEAAGGTADASDDVLKMLTYTNQAADASGDWLSLAATSIFDIDAADKSTEMNGGTMTIRGGAAALEGETPQVTAQIFAGGLLGYNASQTSLTVQNYTGVASVTANSAVAGSTFEGTLGLVGKYGDGRNYSFSGGILGYVPEKTMLYNCRLGSTAVTDENGAASVTTPATATYLGGLAEINEGIIKNSSAALIDGSQHSYAGGVAGVNGNEIENCSMPAGVTVSACVAAGGITAENYGRIRMGTASVDGNLTGGSNASAKASLGGVAGVNRGTILLGETANYGLKVSTQNAAYAGGIAGENRGTIGTREDSSVQEESVAQITVKLNDEATAPATLGGVAGLNSGMIENMICSGTIVGSGNGASGEDAYSYGGIAGVNTGIIEKCDLYNAKISYSNESGRGYVGGIAGRNSGSAVIRNINPEYTATITAAGAYATGGIAGLNEDNATVENLSSGAQWLVQDTQSTAGMQGAAGPVGGVIGLHTSSARLNGLTNLAGSGSEDETPGVVSDGAAAGGIVGRVAVESGAAFAIQDCHNYGSVKAARKAGGIVGEWASNADGSVRGCFNGKTSDSRETPNDEGDEGDLTATITADAAAGAAGIVGGFSNTTSGQMEILSCTNFGVIDAPYGAGIAAVSTAQADQAAGEGRATVKITDCANAGRNASGAGIAVYYSGNAGNISLQLNRCRNYGRPDNDNENEFAGLAACIYDENGKTIFDEKSEKAEKGRIKVENSISVADVKYPTVPGTYAEMGDRVEGKSVYYYSCNLDTQNHDPSVLDGAGIGAAVSYLTGDIQAPGETLGSIAYLQAINAFNNEQFNPNGKGYAQDCRGNFNRLDISLASACLKLVRDEADGTTTPAPKNLNVVNNGGELNITWENRKAADSEDRTETPEPDGGDGSGDTIVPDEPDGGDGSGDTIVPDETNGVVYKTKLTLKLYGSKDEAEKNESELTNKEAPDTYSVTLYGDSDFVSYVVTVNPLWMYKWARVSVTNYAYNGAESDTVFCCIKILPQLLDPQLVVRLEAGSSEQGADVKPVYVLDLLNKDLYRDNYTLEVTVQAEELAPETEITEIPEDGSEEGEEQETAETQTDESAQETTARTAQCQLSIPRGSFPYALTENIGEGFFASSETANVHLTFKDAQMVPEGDSSADKSPSKKQSFTALTLSDSKLKGSVYTSDPQMALEGNAVTVALVGEPALYRAELLYDVQVDDYLLKDLVVDAAQGELTADASTVSMSLTVPEAQADQDVRARVYPFEMSGAEAKDGAKLGYLVESGLSLEALMSKADYVEIIPAQQPTAEIQTEAPVQAQQVLEETEPETEAAQQEVSLGGVTPVTPVTAAETQGEAAGVSEDGEGQTNPTNLTTVQAKSGYSIVRNSNGTFSVYYSVLMTDASPYGSNVFTWNQTVGSGAAETSAIGAGAGAAAVPVSQAGSGDETESETEEVWEEEETEYETEAETERETEKKLSVPTSAALFPSWENPGTELDDNGNTKQREAVPEEEFRNGLLITVDPVDGADGYLMRAAFYSGKPENNGAPNGALRLFSENTGFDGMYDGEWPNRMTGFGSLLSNVPTKFAGQYLCVQFCAYTEAGLMSEWSDYKWFRLPKVCLESPTLKKETAQAKELMTTTQSAAPDVPVAETEVELQHLSLSWEQEKYETSGTARTEALGWEHCGYTVQLYKMLDSGVTDSSSDAYKNPTATVNLMRDEESGGYNLEREYTAAEIEEWQKTFNGETPKNPRSVPFELVVSRDSVTDPATDEEYVKEFQEHPELEKIYSLKLDQRALGTEAYSVELSQTVDEETRKLLLYPTIQIREYTEESSNLKETVQIEYRLILPDVESGNEGEQNTFLYDYQRYYCTHSVIVKPLMQSVFDERQNEMIVANRTQNTYLAKTGALSTGLKDTGDLLNYQRILKPAAKDSEEEKFDKPFDPEKEKNIFNGSGLTPSEYGLLPRNCGQSLFWTTGEAANMIAQTDDLSSIDVNAAGEISFTFDDNGNLVLDTEAEEVIDETVPIEDSMDNSDIPADDSLITEGETFAPEPATEAQTQGQPGTEMWTDSSYETPIDLSAYNGEGD